MKTIIIEIAEDGSLKLDAQGFKGADCEKATKALEDAIGTTSGRKKKPEWYQTNAGNNSQHIGR